MAENTGRGIWESGNEPKTFETMNQVLGQRRLLSFFEFVKKYEILVMTIFSLSSETIMYRKKASTI